MASENRDLESNSADSSYGGSTYRLSYDHKENKKSAEKHRGFKAIIAVIISLILLIVFAYLALKSYDKAIERLYAAETTANDDKPGAGFQSSVNIVTE